MTVDEQVRAAGARLSEAPISVPKFDRLRRRRRRAWTTAAVALTVVALGGLSALPDDKAQEWASSSPDLVWSSLPSDVGRRFAPYDTYGAMAPNTSYAFTNGERRTMSDLMVVGTVVDARPVGGLAPPARPDDPPVDRHVDIGDPSAEFGTFRVTLDVERSYGSSGVIESPDRVTFYLTLQLNAAPEVLASSLGALDRVVAPLYEGTPLVPRDPTAFGVVDDGRMLASVDRNERLSLPGVESPRAQQLLEATPDISTLDRQASAQHREIPVSE